MTEQPGAEERSGPRPLKIGGRSLLKSVKKGLDTNEIPRYNDFIVERTASQQELTKMMTDTTPIHAAVKVGNNVVFEGLFADAHPLYERLVDSLQDVSVILDVYPTVNWRERKTIYNAQIDTMHDAICEASIHGATEGVMGALYGLLDKARENYLPYEYMADFESREAFKRLEAADKEE